MFSGLDAFISFSCPLALAKTSSIILNRSDENRHSCLVSDFRENAQLLTVLYDVTCGLIICSFYTQFVESIYGTVLWFLLPGHFIFNETFDQDLGSFLTSDFSNCDYIMSLGPRSSHHTENRLREFPGGSVG